MSDARPPPIDREVVMLRALGIAFIICTFLFGAVCVVGLGYWAVSSGTVQIKGINDDSKSEPSFQLIPPTAKPEFNDAADSLPVTIGVVPHQHRSVRVNPAAYAVPVPDTPQDKIDTLDNAKVVEVRQTTTDGFVWRWDISELGNQVMIPDRSKAVTVVLKSATAVGFHSDTGDDLGHSLGSSPVNATLTKGLLLKERIRSGSVVFDRASPQRLEVTYDPFTSGTHTVGAVVSSRDDQALIEIPVNDQTVRFNQFLNGSHQNAGDDVDKLSAEQELLGESFTAFYSVNDPFSDPTFFVVTDVDANGKWPTVTRLSVNRIPRSDGKSGKAISASSPQILGAMPEGSTARLIAFSKNGSTIGSSNILKLKRAPLPPGAGINDLALVPEPTSVEGASYAKATATFNVNVSDGGQPTQFDLVLRSGSTILKRHRLTGNDPEQISSVSLPAGPQTITATLYRGTQRIGTVKSLNITSLASGPSVLSVDATQFTSSHDGIIRIQFERNNPLDPVKAGHSANYALFHAANPGTAVPPKSATFNVADNSVNLQFSRDLQPGNYQLRIHKTAAQMPAADKPTGITNVLSQPLVTEPGSADYLARAIAKNISLEPPSASRGLGSAYAGEHIEFPEYTKPRKYEEGFNPSDKVVTRVARLYYFRDAHRVTQIVNRKAKSYNRAAVDMKQQFADTARRQAEVATVERRELEREAVRAAQEAREAENTLEVHQQALIKARDQVGRLQVEVDRLDSLITELDPTLVDFADADEIDLEQRDLDRAKVLQQKGEQRTRDESEELISLLARTDNGDFQQRFSDFGLNDSDLKRRQSRIRDFKRVREAKKKALDRAELQVMQEEALVRELLSTIQAKRTDEIRKTERWDLAEQEERLKAEEQFRREIAAKTEDPDTYAAANPKSDDPVTQVSLSVIGEGLIQMRGPRKGVNEVHKIINQIDAPVGQVKVAIHTVQVNGERGDRMEKVVMRIQRYLDHSRFLTIQSAQMLRNAVVKVASRRASQIAQVCPPGTAQEIRDFKYQQAFFGQDFIQELQTLDSEFLRTGNKVLSLNSMDTTSLSNAMFLLALAKNDVREEILREFMGAVTGKLPHDECQFFEESGAEYKYRHKKFKFMAHHAKFTALRGFFDAEVAGSDTLNPMQREFVRLAQIFKARLVTENELRQRVMERALIEQRIGDVSNRLQDASRKEEEANSQLRTAETAARKARASLLTAIQQLQGQVCIVRDNTEYVVDTQDAWQNQLEASFKDVLKEQLTSQLPAIFDVTIGQVGSAITLWMAQGIMGNARFSPRSPEKNVPKNSDTIIEELITKHGGVANLLEDLFPPNIGSEVEENASTVNGRIRKLIEENLSVPRHAIKNLNFEFTFDDTQYHLEIDLENLSNKSDWKLTLADTTQPGWEAFESSIDSYERDLRGLLQSFESSVGTARKPGIYSSLQNAREYLDLIKKWEKDSFRDLSRLYFASQELVTVGDLISDPINKCCKMVHEFEAVVRASDLTRRQESERLLRTWYALKSELDRLAVAIQPRESAQNHGLYGEISRHGGDVDEALKRVADVLDGLDEARLVAQQSRRPLDHKKFLDMLVDDVEEKFIELVEGTRAQTSNIDNYLKRLGTALEDDMNAQFYHPAFRHVRETSYFYDVNVGQVETTSVVANNRMFAKVNPQATMEFDLPKRDILINEAFNSALAAYNDYGALMGDPNFLSLMKMYGGQSPSTTFGNLGQSPYIQEVLPGLPSGTDAQFMSSANNNVPRIGSNLEALIPDPAIYKFETGTGYEIRPVIQPDGQSVVFHIDYMYTTNVREPVRADEKHLGRVKRHFINTDVVSGNYELREVSTYQVGLKASRTSRGVPLLEDAPGIGVLFRPLPSDESSLQENIILSHTVIYPTLFDLMGLRWAPAVADLDSLSLQEREFVTRNRERFLQNEVFDYSSLQVDDFMRIPEAERRADLYRTQESIPRNHPNGYQGSGLGIKNGHLQEGYAPEQFHPQSRIIHRRSEDSGMTLEQDPRTPVLKLPSKESVRVPGATTGEFVPGTDRRWSDVDNGATPVILDPSHGGYPVEGSFVPQQPQHSPSLNPQPMQLPQGQFSPVDPSSADGPYCPPNSGSGKPTVQMSYQQADEIPRLNEGDICGPQEPSDVLPPVTRFQQDNRGRLSTFSKKMQNLSGKLFKGFNGQKSEAGPDVIKIRSSPFKKAKSMYSKLSSLRSK